MGWPGLWNDDEGMWMRGVRAVLANVNSNRYSGLWMFFPWIGIVLSIAALLVGFGPAPGPLLTAQTGGYAVGAAPPQLTVESTRAVTPARSQAGMIVATIQARLAAAQTATPVPTNAITTTNTATNTTTGGMTIALPLVQNAAPTATPQPMGKPTAMPAVVPTPDGIARTAYVPILMYHYLSEPPEDADIYRRDLSVTPERFAAQLDRLQAEGYVTIGLDALVLNLTRGVPLPPKPVILTFDDGYRDNYENAFPLLVERNMTATFFIITDFIDQERPGYLTWDMVREMNAAGMTIGSHGRNHMSLKGQDTDYLVWQALGSRETIEYELGMPPHYVSYPAGEYDQATMDLFHSAHYWAGVTTVQGATHSSDDLFELSRVRVRGTTTPDSLMQLLKVDW